MPLGRITCLWIVAWVTWQRAVSTERVSVSLLDSGGCSSKMPYYSLVFQGLKEAKGTIYSDPPFKRMKCQKTHAEDASLKPLWTSENKRNTQGHPDCWLEIFVQIFLFLFLLEEPGSDPRCEFVCRRGRDGDGFWNKPAGSSTILLSCLQLLQAKSTS